MQGNHYRLHYVGLSLHWMALSWIISRMTRGLQQEACAMVGAKQFGGCRVMFVDHAMWICAAACLFDPWVKFFLVLLVVLFVV